MAESFQQRTTKGIMNSLRGSFVLMEIRRMKDLKRIYSFRFCDPHKYKPTSKYFPLVEKQISR